MDKTVTYTTKDIDIQRTRQKNKKTTKTGLVKRSVFVLVLEKGVMYGKFRKSETYYNF